MAAVEEEVPVGTSDERPNPSQDHAVEEPPEQPSRETRANDDDSDDDAKISVQSPVKMKTDSSYYHFASTPAEQAAMYKPRRVESSNTVDAKSSSSGSLWNTGATMEEFDYSSWMKERLKEVLLNFELSSPELRIDSFDKCEGSATVLFVRGKLRPGCDMSLKCKWKGTLDDVEVEGTIEIDDICLDDDPDEWSFSVSSKKSARAFKRAKRSIANDKERMLEAISGVCDELRAKRQ